MIRFRDKRFLAVAIVVAALVVFVLPAFVAFRYTAPEQRGQFLTHPWRGWSFAYAAFAVPGDAELKTSGMALRKADWLYKGTAVDPREVQLLYVARERPYTFAHTIDGRDLTSAVVPSYRFIWQVRGVVDTISDRDDTVVALLDYDTGRVLYDIRDDLTAVELAPPPRTPPLPARRHDQSWRSEGAAMTAASTTAFYETDWFKAVVYIVIAIIVARVVDFILARRDRAMARVLGRTPDRADHTRYVMIRRLIFVGILFVGIGIALLQIPAVGTLARAMLASAAIIAGVIGIAARAPIANLVSGVMIAFSQPVRLERLHQRRRRVRHRGADLAHLHVHPHRRRPPRRDPQRGLREKAVHNYSMGSSGSMVTVDISLPLDADVERWPRRCSRSASRWPRRLRARRTASRSPSIAADGVRLRLHAWAADPLRRRELASDLRAALLRRLTADGLIGSGEADGGD